MPTLRAEQSVGAALLPRINVAASGLAGHGTKGDRPDFVPAHYSKDKADDFNVGDLRGVYAVFMPDEVRTAIANAIE